MQELKILFCCLWLNQNKCIIEVHIIFQTDLQVRENDIFHLQFIKSDFELTFPFEVVEVRSIALSVLLEEVSCLGITVVLGVVDSCFRVLLLLESSIAEEEFQ